MLKNKLFKAADYLPQEGLDAVKRLYGLAIKPFGRQLPEVVRCNQNCLDDLQKCSGKVFGDGLNDVGQPKQVYSNLFKTNVKQMDYVSLNVTGLTADV